MFSAKKKFGRPRSRKPLFIFSCTSAHLADESLWRTQYQTLTSTRISNLGFKSRFFECRRFSPNICLCGRFTFVTPFCYRALISVKSASFVFVYETDRIRWFKRPNDRRDLIAGRVQTQNVLCEEISRRDSVANRKFMSHQTSVYRSEKCEFVRSQSHRRTDDDWIGPTKTARFHGNICI